MTRILPFGTRSGETVNVELSKDVDRMTTEEICREANQQLPGVILTRVDERTVSMRNTQSFGTLSNERITKTTITFEGDKPHRPTRPKTKRNSITPAQRNLLIHMRDTGGWMLGDPVRSNAQVLNALARKGLITIHTHENAPWQQSAELTEAGRTFFETP